MDEAKVVWAENTDQVGVRYRDNPNPIHNSNHNPTLSIASIKNWAALHKNVPNVLSRCHTKRRTGFLDFLFFGKVGVIPKEGWARHLLV